MGRDDDDEREQEERAAILRRRALFVASAIAGLSLPTACSDTPPGACLDVAIPEPPAGSASASARPDAGAQPTSTGEPQVCLNMAPQPCLDMPAPPLNPPPGVCLKMRPPPPPPPPAPTVCLEAPVMRKQKT